ncbi:transposase [Streptomyces avermitilis]|uniref:transposase n=1 Tax=Streptomyces avermitilis TaxID=33903 RepID=UPI0036C44DD0
MGRPPRDRRQVFDGIRWRARPGSPWRDIPGRYGPRETAYTLSRRWQMYGTWRSVLKKVQVEADADGHIECEVSVEAGQRADAPVFTEGQAQSRVPDWASEAGRRSRDALQKTRRPL